METAWEVLDGDSLGAVWALWWAYHSDTSGKECETCRGRLFCPRWWETAFEVVLIDILQRGDDCEKRPASDVQGNESYPRWASNPRGQSSTIVPSSTLIHCRYGRHTSFTLQNEDEIQAATNGEKTQAGQNGG